MSELYIGVMSGTSLDGIDISLCKIDKATCKEIYSNEYSFDKNLKKDILKTITSTTTLKQFGEINCRLGLLYIDAINSFIDEFKIDKTKVKAIGLHGQTLWHEPDSEYPFSMQLGCASLASKKVGIDVVSDFRSGDIALGGQGAPFTPAFHKLLFSNIKIKSAVLNLGGIANITILDNKTVGYDIAPANMLLDAWIQKTKGDSYDAYGEWASGGNIDEKLLENMLDEPFFKKDFPKSTGRELFNLKWLEDKLNSNINAQNVQRTLVELLVVSVQKEIKTHQIKQLILCGGGANNNFVKSRLEESLGIEVKISNELGVNSDSLEAMAFAWLAYKRVHLEKVDLKDITGARENGVLGAIYAKN